ncbi:cation:H+ antiporter [Nocardioides sp. YR527]|uniref:calcium/sodium antiporter n=1 Tax=Nocardioides sp. YR527 TaxID=1881028 RepID=UPI000880F37E|nr:calcium/sodium antiporter [Nocardioides sp. YR527]SDK50535.1 cation:H+ antiporter [Nocardioides sp. YR527]
MSDALLVIGGLLALLGGAELVVRAGTGLATRLSVRPIIIGLTVVSVGTSVPELAIGIDAAVNDSPNLAVGNIVGTNLLNFLFILGLSALLIPIAIDRRTLKFDLPAMIASTLVLYLMSLDGILTRLDGALLVAGAVAYTLGLLHVSRRETTEVQEDYTDTVSASSEHRLTRIGLSLVLGLALVVLGAELLVEGAVSAAHALGISDAVVGLTIIAIGTSAPELITTIMSTVRGNRDIAIGNLLGSSIYNIAAVLGLTVLIAPNGVPVSEEVLNADLVLLVAAMAAALPVLVSGARITRVEGGLFVATYVGYLAWLLLTRT